MAINVFINRIAAVVFTKLGSEVLSIISMRPSSKKERLLL